MVALTPLDQLWHILPGVMNFRICLCCPFFLHGVLFCLPNGQDGKFGGCTLRNLCGMVPNIARDFNFLKPNWLRQYLCRSSSALLSNNLSFHSFFLAIAYLVEACIQKSPEYYFQYFPALDQFLPKASTHIHSVVDSTPLSPTHHITLSLDTIFPLLNPL